MEELKYLQIANHPVMWLVCIPGILLVLFQAFLFTKKAIATGRQIGLTDDQFKSAARSSAIGSIGPSLAIVAGMIALLSSMGGPVAWMRLSYIGSVTYELTSASNAAAAVGSTIGTNNMTQEAFACGVWVMVICCLGWIITSTLFADKMEVLKDRVAGDSKVKLAVIATAGGMGSFGYQSFNRAISLTGIDRNGIAVIGGFVVMLVLALIGKKSNAPKWIKSLGMTIAMFAGMLAAVLIL